MDKEELDLLDREERIFTCFQAAIELLHPNEEARNPERTRELLDFLAEEYMKTRAALLRLVDAQLRRQGGQHGISVH